MRFYPLLTQPPVAPKFTILRSDTSTTKRASCVFLSLLVLILLLGDSTCARILQGSALSVPVMEDMANLMGSEECSGNDEACFSRRMIEDAHLDYIYTQHHKPRGSSP